MSAIAINSADRTGNEFQPAFLDKATGQVEIARQRDGKPATMHVINWLPKDWGASFDSNGGLARLRDSVVAGFTLDGIFYTRAEVAEL